MMDKNKKVVIFGEFFPVCSYFTHKVSVNNGYGCNHPDQKESGFEEGFGEESGREQGKCYCWSCPLGCETDEEDWGNPEVDFDGLEKENFLSTDGEWLMDGEHLTVRIGSDASIDEKLAMYYYEKSINKHNPDWDGGTWKDLFTERENRINADLEKYKMAYRIKDVDGNTFCFQRIEYGSPVYRGQGAEKHIYGMAGYTVVQQWAVNE